MHTMIRIGMTSLTFARRASEDSVRAECRVQAHSREVKQRRTVRQKTPPSIQYECNALGRAHVRISCIRATALTAGAEEGLHDDHLSRACETRALAAPRMLDTAGLWSITHRDIGIAACWRRPGDVPSPGRKIGPQEGSRNRRQRMVGRDLLFSTSR